MNWRLLSGDNPQLTRVQTKINQILNELVDGTDTEQPVNIPKYIEWIKRVVKREREIEVRKGQHMVGVNKFIVTMRLLMDVNALGDYELQTSGHEHEQTKSIFETINMILWKQPIHSK